MLDGACRFLHCKPMTETQQLIERIKRLAEKQGLAPSTIGARVLGGGSIFASLVSGRTITLAKYERAQAALSEMEQAA